MNMKTRGVVLPRINYRAVLVPELRDGATIRSMQSFFPYIENNPQFDVWCKSVLAEAAVGSRVEVWQETETRVAVFEKEVLAGIVAGVGVKAQ